MRMCRFGVCGKGEKPHQATHVTPGHTRQTRPPGSFLGSWLLPTSAAEKGLHFVTKASFAYGELVGSYTCLHLTSAAELIQEETRRYYSRHLGFRCLQFW
jgi:hypothetical protein